MTKKYELTEETINFRGRVLHRIKAIKDFGNVKAEELGGFIECESNLSHSRDSWIYGDAKVFDNAEVFDDAWVSGDAKISGNAKIHGNAWVYNGAWIHGNAEVYENAAVSRDAKVYGNAKISGSAWVSGNAKISGDAWVSGDATVSENANIFGNVYISGNAKVLGFSKVSGCSIVSENAIVSGYAWVFGDACVSGDEKISGDEWVFSLTDEKRNLYERHRRFYDDEYSDKFNDCSSIDEELAKNSVAKEEQFDRNQYDKGYKDGYTKAIEDFAEKIKDGVPFRIDDGEYSDGFNACSKKVLNRIDEELAKNKGRWK